MAPSSAPPSRRAQHCQYCNHQFSRSDSLRRHVQTHVSRRPPAPRQKSCQRCVRLKTRCSRTVPTCASCRLSSVSCSYPSNATAAISAVESSSASTTPLDRNNYTLPTQDWSLELPTGVYLWNLSDPSNYCDPDLDWLLPPDAAAGSLTENVDSMVYPNFLPYDIVPQNQSEARDPFLLQPPLTDAMDVSEWQSSKASLPHLSGDRECLMFRRFAIAPMTEATRSTILHTLQLPTDKGPWPPSSGELPSSQIWDFLIDLYFAHFQPVIPIIHQPTFDPNTANVSTVVAITIIGACYSDLEYRHAFATSLWEMNRRLLWFISESDPHRIRTNEYVTSQLLQSIFAKGSGDKRISELSESTRNQVVSNAAAMGFFNDCDFRKDGDVNARWYAWIKEESSYRLGWATYAYDAAFSFQLNKRPCVSLAILRLALPSPQAYWEADSAQAWDALHPSERWTPQRIAFGPVIGRLLKGHGSLAYNSFYYDITLYTLMRLLWTQSEMGALFRAHLSITARERTDQATDEILQALDIVAEEAPEESRGRQIRHLATLYAADGLMEWLIQRLRGGSGKADAMHRWAAASSQRVRRIVFHSAQILSLIRRYPGNHPMEPFNAFYAGAVLWHLACWLRSQRNTTSIVLRLDTLEARIGHDPMLEQWLDTGTPAASIGINGIADITSDTGPRETRDYVIKILENMPVWAVAGTFRQTLIRLEEPV